MEAKFDINIIEVYKLFGNSNLDCFDALCELIDNAYSACSKNNTANIKIRIIGNWNSGNLNLSTAKLIIEDNGIGISPSEFGNVLVPGKTSKNVGLLNQFRVGLKHSLMTLGCSTNSNEIFDFEIISKQKKIMTINIKLIKFLQWVLQLKSPKNNGKMIVGQK